MVESYLYKDFITRRIRFRDRASFLRKISSLKSDTSKATRIIIDGCQVTGTSPFVDIQYPHMAATTMPDKATWLYSYVSFYNSVEDTQYFAFIDRIEPNNFNKGDYDGASYRLFITIDWWSMMLVYQNEKLENALHMLEGEIVRAHVCDVVKPQSGYWRPNAFYLILSAETEYGEVKNEIVDYFNDPCLYVVSSEIPYIGVGQQTVADTPLRKQGIYSKATGDYDTQIQGYVYAFPLELYNNSNFKQPAAPKLISVINNDDSQSVLLQELPTIHSVTDRSVIKQMIYPFCPNYFTNGALQGTYLINTDWTVIDIPKISFTIGESNTAQGAPLFYDKNEHSMFIGALGIKYGVDGIPNLIDMDYNDYLRFCIRRIDMPPYREYAFVYGNNELPLPVHYTPLSTDRFDLIISPDYDGGLICRYNTIINEGDYHKDVAYMSRGTFTPLYTYDSETVQRMEIIQKEETTNHIFNQISNLRKAASGISMGIRGATNLELSERMAGGNAVGDGIINTAKEAYRHSIANDKISLENTTLRLTGENGFSTQTGVNSLGDWTAYICEKSLNPASHDKVLRDLALYGYNTYLHPHELFKPEHKRKYFNYIKTRGANLNATGIVLDIRLHIEEMFNNGVWLWNTDEEFGNFEVPNYLLIMEE